VSTLLSCNSVVVFKVLTLFILRSQPNCDLPPSIPNDNLSSSTNFAGRSHRSQDLSVGQSLVLNRGAGSLSHHLTFSPYPSVTNRSSIQEVTQQEVPGGQIRSCTWINPSVSNETNYLGSWPGSTPQPVPCSVPLSAADTFAIHESPLESATIKPYKGHPFVHHHAAGKQQQPLHSCVRS
jgi:hypothetical protein